MPFRSQAQRSFMWANHPKIARRFEAETPKGKKLPDQLRDLHRSLNKGRTK